MEQGSIARQPCHSVCLCDAAGVGTSYTLIALGTQSAVDAFKQVRPPHVQALMSVSAARPSEAYWTWRWPVTVGIAAHEDRSCHQRVPACAIKREPSWGKVLTGTSRWVAAPSGCAL